MATRKRKYAVNIGTGWNYFVGLASARKFAQRYANSLQEMVPIHYVNTAGQPMLREWADHIMPKRTNSTRLKQGNPAWIPATAVRMLPGGKVQVKVPRGSVRNPLREVIDPGPENTAFYNPGGKGGRKRYEIYNYKTGDTAGVFFDLKRDANAWVARRKAETSLKQYWRVRVMKPKNVTGFFR